MATTRAFRGARCALHGLSSGKDGRCALCRVSPERTRGPLGRHSAWLLGAAALCAGSLIGLVRSPAPAPQLHANSNHGARSRGSAARSESNTQTTARIRTESAGAARSAVEADDATSDETEEAEPSDLQMADSFELIPAEDHHLGESGGVQPSRLRPDPRVPDPPAPAAADREIPVPDDPHDFDLPPPGEAQTPWRPPL
jgi:hypothetical protein